MDASSLITKMQSTGGKPTRRLNPSGFARLHTNQQLADISNGKSPGQKADGYTPSKLTPSDYLLVETNRKIADMAAGRRSAPGQNDPSRPFANTDHMHKETHLKVADMAARSNPGPEMSSELKTKLDALLGQ